MVFNDSEIEQFISEGYVVLRGVFSREVAEACRGTSGIKFRSGTNAPRTVSRWCRSGRDLVAHPSIGS